jgi:prepilin-type processing-associated H-X9-DG protein
MKLVVGIVLSIAAVLLLGSAFLPTLCRPREAANRVKCSSNLRQIGTAISLYASAHGGVLPDSFGTLAHSADLVPEVFTSTAERADSIETLATHPTKDNCNYTYLGNGLRSVDVNADVILMVEDLDDHDRDGLNILFGDGHVDFLRVNRKTPQKWYVALEAAMKRKATTRPVKLLRETP